MNKSLVDSINKSFIDNIFNISYLIEFDYLGKAARIIYYGLKIFYIF
jgi:hypothetical protein